jgi:intein/homing endonuclease
MAVISQKYIAGLFDGDGCIYACATHNGNSYVFRTNLQMLLRRKPFEVLYEIKGFLARKGIHATVRKRPSHHSRSGEELVLYISSRTSVKRFLELLLPWLRVKRPQAIVMLTQIIPRLEKGEHLTRRGFLELMRWADVLTLLKGDTLEAKKYTYAYFLKIWGDENALSEPIFSNAKEKATK